MMYCRSVNPIQGLKKCDCLSLNSLQGDRSLMVQWMDVNQLSQEENLHSKCLCVDRLPLDLCDSEELTQLFSETYKPVFCQVSFYFCKSSVLDRTI